MIKVIAIAVLCFALCGAVRAEVLVAVAANFLPAMEVIAERFEKESGDRVELTAGASGTLARQIVRGAPFELFLSADRYFPAWLCERHWCETPPVHYATGRLALFLPASIDVPTPLTKTGLEALLQIDERQKIAIANPEHAPYGRAAKQAFEYHDLWGAVMGRLVVGESVAQTARFAAAGTVNMAVLPGSAVANPNLGGFQSVPIPQQWYDVLVQDMALVKGASDEARRLFVYLQSPELDDWLTRSGYVAPARTR